jgi:hypothetical protein
VDRPAAKGIAPSVMPIMPHAQRGDAGLALLLAPALAREERRESHAERRRADRRGDGAHQEEVASLISPLAKKNAALLTGSAHVEGDHRAEQHREDDGVAGASSIASRRSAIMNRAIRYADTSASPRRR